MAEKVRAGPGRRLPGEGQGLQGARFILLCALLALLAGSGALFLSANYWRQQIGGLKNLLPANVDMRLGHLTLNETNDRGQTMVIMAETALYNQNDDSFLLSEVRAKVDRGQELYDITADTGRYDQARKIITLIGRAKVVENSGGLLLSERLILKLEAGLLISESHFCYADPETELEGSTFVYQTRDRRLTAEGPVELVF